MWARPGLAHPLRERRRRDPECVGPLPVASVAKQRPTRGRILSVWLLISFRRKRFGPPRGATPGPSLLRAGGGGPKEAAAARQAFAESQADLVLVALMPRVGLV